MSLTASRFALSLCLASALPAWADSYTIRGAGPCDEWKADAGDRGWLLGYLSGYNAARSSHLTEGMKNDDLVEQMTQICKGDPSQDFDDAVQVLIGRLAGASDEAPASVPPAAARTVTPPAGTTATPPQAAPPPSSSPVPVPSVAPPAAPTTAPSPPSPPRSTLRPTAGSR